jgi:ferredoxin-NADP reductase/uncharacterized protein YcbX
MAVLQDIIRYPIKGFSGQKLTVANLTIGSGLPFDRFIGFTNGQHAVMPNGDWTRCGAFVRLTKNSTLPRFKINFDDADAAVTITHPEGQRVYFQIADEASLAAAQQSIESWFPLGHLVLPKIAQAKSGLGYWDHDDAAISIINLDSVAQLSGLAGIDIDPRRFRGNLHIKGGGAWSELDLIGRRLRIGAAEFEVLRPIDRCSAPSVNPDSGDIDLNIPAILARHVGHIYCGVYARVIKVGVIRPQDRIEILAHAAGIVKAASQRPTAPPAAQWPRTGEITSIKRESDSVVSFWIKDCLVQEGIAPDFVPGQHVRLHGIGPDQSSWRNYTVSARRADGDLRISVKRDPSGACSGWLHDHLKTGDSVTISGPFGAFVQPEKIERPVMMLSAGIGITPLLAMLSSFPQTAPDVRLRFVHVVRSVNELALWDEVVTLAASMPNVTLQLYIDQDPSDRRLPAHTHHGKIQWDNEIARLAESKAITYLCGPKGFMQAARQQLRGIGIPDDDILEEIFASPAKTSGSSKAPPKAGPFSVHFTKSGVTANWSAAVGSLLDLAEAFGINLPANCRGGACGTCAQTIQSGNVAYTTDPVITTGGQQHLLCCAVPVSDMKIDA